MRLLSIFTLLAGVGNAFPIAAAEWTNLPQGRFSNISLPTAGAARFSILDPSHTAVAFTNQLTDSAAAENQIRLNGSGVALGDFDGDGLCDIYLCSLTSDNGLFRNLGAGRFTNVTASAGVACPGEFSSGAVFADTDGDGDLDLLVSAIGTGVRLFTNDGKGRFQPSTNSGLHRRFAATTMTLGDVDGDGDLDLYVANYKTSTIRSTGFSLLNMGGTKKIRLEDRDSLELTPEGRVLEHGEPHLLYVCQAPGVFDSIPWNSGRFLDENGNALRNPPRDWGLAAMFRDLNGDGAPDLYVCNDFHSPDRFWLNDGKGAFKSAPPLTLRHISTFSMCVDVADVNRDGHDDIFVADMLSPNHPRALMQLSASEPYVSVAGIFRDVPQFDRNTLQLSRGDGTYADVAELAGIDATDWTWAAFFLDFDLDGYEDLFCSTGHMFDTQDLDADARIAALGAWSREKIAQKVLLYPKMQQRKLAFRNNGNLIFSDKSSAWGFDQLGVSHGMAMGDLDNDGDLDIVSNNLNSAAVIYRNDCPNARIAVRLRGKAPNTRGIGAKVTVLAQGISDQTQEMISGGRYLSGDDYMRVFAAGMSGARVHVRVRWRSGIVTELRDVPANSLLEVFEP